MKKNKAGAHCFLRGKTTTSAFFGADRFAAPPMQPDLERTTELSAQKIDASTWNKL
jgi:hypothetical protein